MKKMKTKMKDMKMKTIILNIMKMKEIKEIKIIQKKNKEKEIKAKIKKTTIIEK